MQFHFQDVPHTNTYTNAKLYMYKAIHYTLFVTEKGWEFPGSSVDRTQRFHCHGLGSIPGQGTKIPQAVWHSPPKKERK